MTGRTWCHALKLGPEQCRCHSPQEGFSHCEVGSVPPEHLDGWSRWQSSTPWKRETLKKAMIKAYWISETKDYRISVYLLTPDVLSLRILSWCTGPNSLKNSWSSSCKELLKPVSNLMVMITVINHADDDFFLSSSCNELLKHVSKSWIKCTTAGGQNFPLELFKTESHT